MTSMVMDEFAAALHTCEAARISPERICRSLGAYQLALMRLMTGLHRVDDATVRIVTWRLRQTAMLVRKERAGLTG